METGNLITGDFDFICSWISSKRAEYAGDDPGVIFLCDAGSDIPQGRRLFLCQHDVYWKFTKRNSSTVYLYKRKKTGTVKTGTLLFWNYILFCNWSRGRRKSFRLFWVPGNLGILCDVDRQLPADVCGKDIKADAVDLNKEVMGNRRPFHLQISTLSEVERS